MSQLKKRRRKIPLRAVEGGKAGRSISGNSVLPVLATAALVGGTFGIGAVAHEQGSLAPVVSAAQTFAINVGWKRRREPQAGDYWGGCNDARAAGVTPLYFGEPGYRDDMDGDGDGVACEPHRR